MTTETWPPEWMRGLLETCVLGVIAGGPTYGYAIASALQGAGAGVVKGGTLYPLLSRLEAAGLVVVDWRAGESGPGRKYYSLSAAGRSELARQARLWEQFAAVTGRLITGSLTCDNPLTTDEGKS